MNKGDLKYIIGGLTFNVCLLAATFLTGWWLFDSWQIPVFVVFTFWISRMCGLKPLHYKKWQLCGVAAYTLWIILVAIAQMSLGISLILALTCGIILSNPKTTQNISLWKPKGVPSKYQEQKEFVKFNPDNSELLAFENKLKESKDNRDYLVYKCLFRDNLTWQETADLLDIETTRLTPFADKVAFGLLLTITELNNKEKAGKN